MGFTLGLWKPEKTEREREREKKNESDMFFTRLLK